MIKHYNQQGQNNGNYIDGRCSKQYFCKCGNKIHFATALYGLGNCKTCSHKGKKRPEHSKRMSGKNHPNYIQEKHEKHYCIEGCGNEICYYNWKDGNGRCKSCARKGVLHPHFGKHRSVVTCKLISKHLKGKYSGKNSGRFGKLSPHGKRIKYRGICFRSSWEVLYTKWLDKQHIKWLYESKTFDLGNTTYTPDFYLPKTDEYIEIKGWWWERTLKKFKLFKKLYPKVNIKVLMRLKLKKLGVL